MANKKIPVFGVLLVIVGFLLVLNTLDIFYFGFGDLMRFLVPLGFIALGIWLIIRKKRQEQLYHSETNFQHFANEQGRSAFTEGASPDPAAAEAAPPPPPPPGGSYSHDSGSRAGAYAYVPPRTEADRLKYGKSFGDMFIDCNNVSLQNVVVSTGVGDVELKLHGGILKNGLNRMVITGFVGDIRILLPQDMPVYVHSSCLVGDIELFGNKTSGFSNDLDGQTTNYNAADDKLYIAINHFIGDIRVYAV